MKKVYCFLIYLFLFFLSGECQSGIQDIKGLSTKEAYDLMLDKKGFIWIGDELGISRMNWNSLNHYSHPAQASLSMTNLIEDGKGRIWCHNFGGQIFYIEKSRMSLLGEYDTSRMTVYPSIAYCNGEIIATSKKGLFICNTANLKCFDIIQDLDSGYCFVTALHDKVVLLNSNDWYMYQKGKALVKLEAVGDLKTKSSYSLQPVVYHDTMFLVDRKNGFVEKVVVDGRQIKLAGRYNTGGYVNGVTIDNGNVWVHTKVKSITINGPYKEVKGRNLTDIVTDAIGNIWYSSLNQGIGVTYKDESWKKLYDNSKEDPDIIRTINVYNGQLICGTQYGSILSISPDFKSIQKKAQVPLVTGGIEFAKITGNKAYLSTSAFSYTYDLQRNILTKSPLYAAKDIDQFDGNLFVASAGVFYIRPLDTTIEMQRWKQIMYNRFPSTHFDYTEVVKLIFGKTCRSVRVESPEYRAAVAFNDGLAELDKDGFHPVTYDKLPVYSNSLEWMHQKLYISTPSNGLLIKDKNGIRNISVNNGGLLSNNLIRIKAVDDHIWILEDQYIQMLDSRTDKIVSQIELPEIGGGDVYDVTELGKNAYITSRSGVYSIPLALSGTSDPNCFLDFVQANDEDTIQENQYLTYHQNNLQFVLSTSWYSNLPSVSLKYRLLGAETKWHNVKSDDGTVRYASLMPGDYTFEAFTEVSNIRQSKHLFFHFSVNRPWWQQWWFYTLCVALFIAFIYGLYRYRLHQILRIEHFRRKLSSDLHDDLGATLSSVNIYAELAKEEKDNDEYLQLIQTHTNDVIRKLRDMIWSINPGNDSYEQLVSRMNSFAVPFMKAAGIDFILDYDDRILRLPIDLNIRQNLYLVFKELINNVAKHSKADRCSVYLSCQQRQLQMKVQDNGIGFDREGSYMLGNGLVNIRNRVNDMNGQVQIEAATGLTIVKVVVPV